MDMDEILEEVEMLQANASNDDDCLIDFSIAGKNL